MLILLNLIINLSLPTPTLVHPHPNSIKSPSYILNGFEIVQCQKFYVIMGTREN